MKRLFGDTIDASQLFALNYVCLMQKNGTALGDKNHELLFEQLIIKTSTIMMILLIFNYLQHLSTNTIKIY